MPNIKRSQIDRKISPTLPTLLIIKRSQITPRISPTLPIYKRSKITQLVSPNFANFANFAKGLSFVHNRKNVVSTLPTLPKHKRNLVSTLLSLTLPTLLRVWVLSIKRELIYQLCQLCLNLKRSQIDPNISQTLPTLLVIKKSKITQ